MADPYGKVQKGQKARLLADTVNQAIDAAKLERRSRFDHRSDPPDPDLYGPTTLRILNHTSGTLPIYSVVKLGAPYIDASANLAEWQQKPNFAAAIPVSSSDLIAILTDPLPVGQLGGGVVAGVCPCQILVGSATDNYASPTAGQLYLTSGTSGSCLILYKQGGTGLLWGLVLLNLPEALGGGGAGGSFLGCEAIWDSGTFGQEYVTSGAVSYPNWSTALYDTNHFLWEATDPVPTHGSAASVLVLREAGWYYVRFDFVLTTSTEFGNGVVNLVVNNAIVASYTYTASVQSPTAQTFSGEWLYHASAGDEIQAQLTFTAVGGSGLYPIQPKAVVFMISGQVGPQGPQGIPGTPGAPGATPVLAGVGAPSTAAYTGSLYVDVTDPTNPSLYYGQ